MLNALIDGLAELGAFTDVLGLLVVALFLSGVLLERVDRKYGRYLLAGAWVVFGLFWLTLIHYFAFEQKSIIEGVGSVLAVPMSLYVGLLLVRGRDSLFVLSRAVTIMALIYLPFAMSPTLSRPLIETVTSQTAWLMDLIGYNPEVVSGTTFEAEANGRVQEIDIPKKEHGFESTFLFRDTAALPITYTIVLACTGIGSMAILAGLILAVDAPADRKLRALAISIPVIYVLNLVRNVFIGLSYGHQYFQLFPGTVQDLFGLTFVEDVSYIWADRIIAQSASVLALVLITWLVVQELPEVLTILEDGIYLLTGREYDLQTAFGVDVPSTSPAD